MDYNTAQELRAQNLHLIGTTDEKGFKIGDIIIIPSDACEQKLFFQTFIKSWDFEVAITPFISRDDLEVWAIDLNYLKQANVLFFNKLG